MTRLFICRKAHLNCFQHDGTDSFYQDHMDNEQSMTADDIKTLKKTAFESKVNHIGLSALILQMRDLQIKSRMPLVQSLGRAIQFHSMRVLDWSF